MIVLGLSGYQRVGKDTVADILVRDYGFEKRSFAAPVKEMLRKLDPVLGLREGVNPDGGFGTHPVRLSDFDGYSEDLLKDGPYGAEYRRLLQLLATDCVRAIDDDFWINVARNSLTDEHGKYVFTDVRFPNESQMIYDIDWHTTKSVGNYDRKDVADVWQVTRPTVGLPEGSHISEQWAGRMGETVEIINNSSLKTLKDTVDIAMNFLMAPVRWMEGV